MSEQAKILVVDDDPDFLDSTRIMLESESYRVALAADEEEALGEIEAETPDLLILDVMMSRLDSGFQFMWRLKRDDRYKAIPILMVTGVDDAVHIDFARDANPATRLPGAEDYLPVEDYIVKPAKMSELLSSVKRILERADKGAPSK